MLTASDLQQAYQMVPGQRTVTLKPRNPTADDVTVDGSRKRPLTRQDLQTFSEIMLHTDSCSWWLPTVNLDGAVPKKGDFITDDEGITWQIDYVNSALMEADYQCFAHKAAA